MTTNHTSNPQNDVHLHFTFSHLADALIQSDICIPRVLFIHCSLIHSFDVRSLLSALLSYMVDAADQEKIEASKNELHNLLDKPQLQGIPVSGQPLDHALILT